MSRWGRAYCKSIDLSNLGRSSRPDLADLIGFGRANGVYSKKSPQLDWGFVFAQARKEEREPVSKTSQFSGFYRLSSAQRIARIVEWAELSTEEAAALDTAGLGSGQADHMIENAIGTHNLPLGIAVNFLIDGQDYLIPMAIEEPSVVAGASYAAKLVRAGGGFRTHSTPAEMIAQIQVLDIVDPWSARFELLAHRDELLTLANKSDPVIVGLGGGARDLQVYVIEDSPAGTMLDVHLIYDCLDAMGANTVNTAAEAIAPHIARITGARTHLRILSNLADRRLVRAHCVVPASALELNELAGETVVDRIVEAYAFAAATPYRAATHNKGIMNGIDAVVVATGNDWRAVEAGAHAYAARNGSYTSLSHWAKNKDGDLAGTLEMPMAVGLVGGATRVHPTAKLAVKILGVKTARELAQIIVAVGLAQNLAAIRALATEGIQRGHMQLHARQVAIAAGAKASQIDIVVRRMIEEKTIRPDRAAAILEELGSEPQ
ncbi:MAG: hydroxymethylglutaryl-CoA reductase, degradative [Anaerolineae bacterium]|nr:hydroxymethylglutaryl-CoA reductase, degradative [Anaerolineae bacterium]